MRRTIAITLSLLILVSGGFFIHQTGSFGVQVMYWLIVGVLLALPLIALTEKRT